MGKYGYKILSFEPSELNYYILKKNFCLNKDVKATIINKGLFTDDKKCDLYNLITNVGNGMTICEKKDKLPFYLKKTGEIILTKLSNYIQFLAGKNLVLIKIDVEGGEEKVFEGGIEIISKYHVPFIFMEFYVEYLRLHNTDPKHFLQMFINNDYKIYLNSFFDEKNYSINDVFSIGERSGLINLYLVYSKAFE